MTKKSAFFGHTREPALDHDQRSLHVVDMDLEKLPYGAERSISSNLLKHIIDDNRENCWHFTPKVDYQIQWIQPLSELILSSSIM